MGSSRKSHRTEHAARFSAGAALTQVCAAAQARLCAACAAAVVRRSRQVETQVLGYHCTAGLRGTLREFTEFQVVKFLFTFSNRCELVFARGLVRSAGRVAGVAMWEWQDG